MGSGKKQQGPSPLDDPNFSVFGKPEWYTAQQEQLKLQRDEIDNRRSEEQKTKNRKRFLESAERLRREATARSTALRGTIVTGSQGVQSQTPIVGGF